MCQRRKQYTAFDYQLNFTLSLIDSMWQKKTKKEDLSQASILTPEYTHTYIHSHTLTLGKVVLSKMPYKHLEMSKENKNKPLTEAKET